jgi:hypothetical protein
MNDTTQASRARDAEQLRQEMLQALAADRGPSWAEEFAPGTLGCHELLDRTFLAAQTVEEYVQAHPACVRCPEWFALAEQVVAALNELYQKVGAAHFTEQSVEAPSS